MTQRVRDGLGLPAGLYCLSSGGNNPTFFAPNGITADGVASLLYADVVPVHDGYDFVFYNSESGLFTQSGSTNPSPAAFNNDAVNFADDVLRQIFRSEQPEGEFPYRFETSESRANIVNDLTTLKADFVLNP